MIFEDSKLNAKHNKPADSAFSVFGLRVLVSVGALLCVKAGRL